MPDLSTSQDSRALPGADFANPVWAALHGPHRGLAEVAEDTCWYPAAVAPFLTVPHEDVIPDLAAAARRGLHTSAYFVGVIPSILPKGWRVASRSTILQLLPTAAPSDQICDTAGARVLGDGDRAAMFELAQRAFPDYFRLRTPELGEYIGIFAGNQLVAMAGERLAFAGWQEISGVCTDSRFAGRGFARRLTLELIERHRRRGVASFLHVGEGNGPARRLYESMGFIIRAAVPLAKIERGETA